LKFKVIALVLACVVPSMLHAQRPIYFGGMGGVATLSGDGSAIINSTSASSSLYDPMNGGAAEAFAGINLFNYVSFQADYVWNRNSVVLTSNFSSPGVLNFYREPEAVTQNAVFGNALVYFRSRGSRLRPYLSEGAGVVFIHSRFSGAGVVGGNPVLPPASSNKTSPALRTSVGLDVQLKGPWHFRFSFGETITRNTFGNQLSPPEKRIPKNFQNLFGIYYQR